MEFVEKTIGEIESLIKTGKTPPSKEEKYYNGSINWYTPGDLDKTKFLGKSSRTITNEAVLDKKAAIFPKNTVLIGAIGDIGKLGITSEDSSSNQQITGIVTNDEIYYEYLYYWLKANKSLLKGRAKNAILPILNNENLRSIKIKFPKEIEDQKRIAKVLSQCEELIKKRKESIDLLDALLQSTFLEMFGDETKFNSMPVEKIASNERYSLSSGPFGSNLTSEHYTKDGIIILRGKNISSGKLDLSDIKYISEEKAHELRRSAIKPNDIVIVAVGSSGTALRIPEQLPYAIMSQNFNKITPNTELVLPTYLEYSINSQIVQRQFKRVMTDAGRTFLGLTKIKEIKIPIPHKKEQIEFEKIVIRIEAIKNKYQTSLNELENLYGSISQRAFKGELDLSKVDISDMEDSKKKDMEEVDDELAEERLEHLISSFEHTLPTGEVPSNRVIDIHNMSLKQYLKLSENDELSDFIEFNHMNKDYFYQFILTKGFENVNFTLENVEQYARKYILRGTGFEFTYDNWKTIIFRFIEAKQPIIEQFFDENTKTIKLRLTNEAFKV